MTKAAAKGAVKRVASLASKTGGPRSRELIDADLARWGSRRDAAKANLERARKLTGVAPTSASER